MLIRGSSRVGLAAFVGLRRIPGLSSSLVRLDVHLDSYAYRHPDTWYTDDDAMKTNRAHFDEEMM